MAVIPPPVDTSQLASKSLPNIFSAVQTLDAPLVHRLATNTVYHYRDLAAYRNNPITGTLKITLPKRGSATMLTIVLHGFDYLAQAKMCEWRATISGYDFTSTSWAANGCLVEGNSPFTSVRFGNDGTNGVILLGTTSTVWSYPRIVVSDLFISFAATMTGWETGWGLSVISSEAGLANLQDGPVTIPRRLSVSSLPSALPANTDRGDNSWVEGSSPAVRIGQIDRQGFGGSGYPTYIQPHHVSFDGLYYNLLLNPGGGNVGIGGVLDPTEKLDVAGNIKASGTVYVPAIVAGTSLSSRNLEVTANYLALSQIGVVSWAPSTGYANAGDLRNVADTVLSRVAANVLSLTGGTGQWDARARNFTVGTLPTPGTGTKGRQAFAVDGRKVGELAGAGTGVQVYDDGIAWRRVSDDSTVLV